MKFEIERNGIMVIPQNKQDEAYIEDTLGLKKEGDYLFLVRSNIIGLRCIACLKTVSSLSTLNSIR
jgi:hypothetical protein